MPNRSLYADGVETTARQLTFTETSKSGAVTDQFEAIGQGGVVSGMAVTVSGITLNRIDIAAGVMYTPNGERMVLSAPATSLAIASTTVGVVNYIGYMYAEAITARAGKETGTATAGIKVEGTANYRAYTDTEFNALVASDDDFSQDVQDRFAIIAVITPTLEGRILASDITIPDLSSTLVTIEQPSAPVTGITITAISDATPAGSAQLELDASGATRIASYQSPQDTALGATVDLDVSSSPVTLTSAATADTVTIEWDIGLLPAASSGLHSVTLAVTKLYENVPQTASAKDQAHRRLLGTGLPTATNPHGQRISDLAEQLLSILQTITVGGGLLGSIAAALNPRLQILAAEQPTSIGNKTQLIAVVNPVASEGYIRVYFDGDTDSLEIVVNALWSDDGTTGEWSQDDITASSARYVFKNDRLELDHKGSGAGTWADSAWDEGTVLAGPDSNQSDLLASTIQLGQGLLVSEATPRISTVHRGIGTRKATLYHDVSFNTPGSNEMRMYRGDEGAGDAANSSDSLEIAFNGSYTNTTWSQTDTGEMTAKHEFSRAKYSILTKDAGAGASWTDTTTAGNWDRKILIDAATGDVSVAGDHKFLTTRTSYLSVPGNSANERVNGTSITYDRLNNGLVKASASTHSFNWPIHVPQGATITAFRAYIRFTGGIPSGSATLELRRAGYDQIGTALIGSQASINATSGTPVGTNRVFEVTGLSSIVDNELYTYYLTFLDTVSTDEIWEVKLLSVEYTTDTVLV